MLPKIESENKSLLDDVIVVAITGSISSGKSEVCKIIEKSNYPIVSTDLLAKKIISESSKIQSQIKQEFGDESFIDKRLNSDYISKLVFGNNESNIKNLIKLNSIVHPSVIELMISNIEELAQLGKKLIFVESALIFEAELEEGFDYIIMVDTIEDLRKERFINKSKLNEQEFNYRNQSQINSQFKRENSDFVIENNTDMIELEKSTLKLLEIILFLPKREF